jgi:hypothetical protein
MRDACLVLSQRHNFWLPVPSSNYFRPVLSPTGIPISFRVQTFRAHGTFLALHCFLMGHGPLPISIWVVLALILGREAMLIPKNILLHMDPAAFDILAPWYDWDEDQPFPPITEPAHPLRLFIFDYMPTTQVRKPMFFPRISKHNLLQPSLISRSRTKEEHEGWKIAAFASVLLSDSNPWTNPDFVALREGFNIRLKGMQFSEVGFIFLHNISAS